MNYYTREDLISILKNFTTYSELHSKQNGSVIISEFGGRPLGLFPKKNNISLLWINPELERVLQKKDSGIGGDRYWLSPERTFFYKKPETWEKWFCPPGLDPAAYTLKEESSSKCTLRSPLSLTNQFTKQKYMGSMIRTIEIIKEPFSTDVDYCGIQFTDECSLNYPNPQLNGWSLATVISGYINNPGTVLIPTKHKPTPLSYFRPIPKDRLILGKNYVAFKIDVNEIYKLAIRPEDIDFSRNAKIGYFLKIPHHEMYGFLIKLSNDIPRTQKECFDVARDHPNSEIGVVQSYNSKSPKENKLQFGEIELQLNKFEMQNDISKGKAIHQLFGYIGNKEEILDVISKYLGIETPQLF
ncbi:MAG: hypothetical protein BAJALOKI1v1_820001 [Promethearchaeota archaeon]|nr:MAG: hypothetical protein BAJALOKI1v1_820001 [Candidatus Lokiarchaeota archaeon]